MARQLFRKSALEKLSSPEQLDQTVTIIKLPMWIMLAAIGLLLVAVIVWAVSGTIPEKVNGSGVLMNSGNLIGVSYNSGGIITDIFIESGEHVQKGQVIARVERRDLLEQLQLTSQRLMNLRQNYEATENLASRQTGQTDAMLAKSEADLRSQINIISTQIEDARRKEKNMKSLLNDGLITEQAYLEARNELLSIQKLKQETEQNLMNIGVNRIKTTGESGQKLLSIQHQIDETQKQLEVQQNAYQEATRIVSPISGMVYEVSVSRGMYIQPGTTVAIVEPLQGEGSVLEAVIFFPVRDGKRIKCGMTIAVTPSTVRQEEYGYIQGIVTQVSEYPVSNRYLISTLQNEGIAQEVSKLGMPLEVKVSLIPDPKTKTGFSWSSSKGPDGTLETGIFCGGAVIVKTRRPIELVIPFIKRKVFGIGE